MVRYFLKLLGWHNPAGKEPAVNEQLPEVSVVVKEEPTLQFMCEDMVWVEQETLETEIKIDLEGKVYRKVKGKWIHDPSVKGIYLVR